MPSRLHVAISSPSSRFAGATCPASWQPAMDFEGSVPMIGIGFVDAGMIGQIAHISNFVDLPGCKVRAIA